MEWSLARLALATLLALAAFAAVHQGAAHAQVTANPDYWKQTTERRSTVYRFVYGQSPQAIPASYDPVREAEEILRQQQRTLPSSNPQVQSLWQRIRGITVKSALSTPPRALGSISVAVGVGYIGWRIGTGINAKFLKLGVPEEIPHTNTDFRGNGREQELVWHNAGYDPYSGRIIQPKDGFTWMRLTDSGRYGYWRTGTPEVGCDMPFVAPPAGLTIVTNVFAGATCYGLPRNTDYHLAYVTEDDLGAPGPIEDYTGQPYDKYTSPPTAPTQSSVEQAIDTELDMPENELLRDWFNYKLGSPGQIDPVTGSFNMPDCVGVTLPLCQDKLPEGAEVVTRTVDYPEADPSHAPNEVIRTEPPVGTETESGSTVTVVLNPSEYPVFPSYEEDQPGGSCDYGPTDYPPEPLDPFSNPEPIPAINPVATLYDGRRYTVDHGWGRVHIATKHGWGTNHRFDTALTLRFGAARTASPVAEELDPLEYILPMPHRGPGCARYGKVERGKLADEPYPKGVITSFGVLVP